MFHNGKQRGRGESGGDSATWLLDITTHSGILTTMRSRVYIETSVVSYYAARPSRDIVVAGHQQATQDFWTRIFNDFEPVISALVVREAGQGRKEDAQRRLDALKDFAVVQVTPEAQDLARQIIDSGGVPPENPEDALHIALATMAGVDFLATWNFFHINNPFTRMMVRRAVENAGYVCPEIVSPDELLGEQE